MNTLHLKFFFILAALCCTLFVYSQQDTAAPDAEELPYKPIAEFNNDTIAFVEYNFIKRPPESYAGMTVGEFIELIDMPVYSCEGQMAVSKGLMATVLCIESGGKKGYDRSLSVSVVFETPVNLRLYYSLEEEERLNLKISAARTEMRIINSVKEDRKPRKPHPMTDVINKDTEEVKKKLKEKKTE